MTKEQTPVNRNPILLCSPCKTATPHTFAEKERHESPRPPKDGKPQEPEVFDDLFFTCDSCGKRRQFGRENPNA